MCRSFVARDLNAAKNVLDEGLRILSDNGASRIGGAVVVKATMPCGEPNCGWQPIGPKKAVVL